MSLMMASVYKRKTLAVQKPNWWYKICNYKANKCLINRINSKIIWIRMYQTTDWLITSPALNHWAPSKDKVDFKNQLIFNKTKAKEWWNRWKLGRIQSYRAWTRFRQCMHLFCHNNSQLLKWLSWMKLVIIHKEDHLRAGRDLNLPPKGLSLEKDKNNLQPNFIQSNLRFRP